MTSRLYNFCVLFMAPLTGMGIDLYAPSLPSIMRELHTSTQLAKLTMATFLLGYAVGQSIFGSISDSFGRKISLNLGMLLFIVASLVAAVAHSIELLLVIRAVQGFAAAAPSIACKACLSDRYTGEALRKVSSTQAIAWGLGPVIGPALGGYIEYYLGWRYNFYFLALYGVLTILFFSLIPEPNKNLIPFNTRSIVNTYKTILSHRIFLFTMFGMGINYASFIIFNVLGPFIIQNQLHYTAAFYGRIALLIGLVYFIGSINIRMLVKYFTSAQILGGSLLLLFVGIAYLAFLGFSNNYQLVPIMIAISIITYALAFIFPTCMAKCLSLFPQFGGTVSAVIGTYFVLITAMTSAIASMVPASSLLLISSLYVILALIWLCCYWQAFVKKPA